jgi:hypothetical protein
MNDLLDKDEAFRLLRAIQRRTRLEPHNQIYWEKLLVQLVKTVPQEYLVGRYGLSEKEYTNLKK